MEIVVAPNMDVIRREVVIGSIINVNCGSNEFLVGVNLNRSSNLPIVNIGVVGTQQMVFINLVMTIHVHKTTNQPDELHNY